MENSNNKQFALKALLLGQTALVMVYTVLAAQKEGWDLFTVFLNNITAYSWNGQFNLDFASYLLLSGIWVMWRNQYSLASILIALVVTIVGIITFAPYLLYLLISEKGDMKKVFLGER